jgi:PQQ-dependent dehydrogenase (methanol/ethanol family)
MRQSISGIFFIAITLTVSSVHAAESNGAAPSTGEWLTVGRINDQTHFSPLSLVNDKNIHQLGLAWYTDMPTADGLLANPLVADGIVYEIGALSKVWAVDVRTGKLLWEHDPHVKPIGTFTGLWTSRLNRGLALFENELLFGTNDCRLVAIDKKTGKSMWDVEVCKNDGSRAANVQLQVGGGKVFIGNSNTDNGVGRGSMDAFDAKTGKHLWRFYTVPGDPSVPENQTRSNAIALKTWGGPDGWKKAAGGSTFAGVTYDAVLNLVYFGVDGPFPWSARDRRGDNLFTESVVAVNADTGEYVWHYQTVPNDTWDMNDCSPIVIAELPIGGKTRRVLFHAPKNGFFYVLDAKTGKLLSADKFAQVNWATRIDMKSGRPVETPNFRYYLASGKPSLVNPGPMGAHNWHAMSYDPDTRLVYFPVTDVAVQYMEVAAGEVGGAVAVDYYAGMKEPRVQHRKGRLIAWDPLTKMSRWAIDYEFPTNGGVLSTAGNLVFQGTATGEVHAYDARNGKDLWSFKTGSSIQAAPSTVEVDGKQIVLIAVGLGGGAGLAIPRYAGNEQSAGPSRILAFALDARVPLPIEATIAQTPHPKPPVGPLAPELVAQGESLFSSYACDYCHGSHADRFGMTPPDLRRITKVTYDQMPAIVIGGAMSNLGMPAFADMQMSELDAIRAYVIDRAWSVYNAEQSAVRETK